MWYVSLVMDNVLAGRSPAASREAADAGTLFSKQRSGGMVYF